MGFMEMISSDTLYARHIKDMSPIEKRFAEAILDEIIFSRKITFSRHAEERAKQRRLSIGRINMAIRQGVVNEVQFDKHGMKFLISFATEQQRKKGYLNYVVLNIPADANEDCKIVSLWNKQRTAEIKLNTDTYTGSKTYIKNKSCLGLIYNYLNENSKDINRGEIISLLRKYDKSPFEAKYEKRIKGFINGNIGVDQL